MQPVAITPAAVPDAAAWAPAAVDAPADAALHTAALQAAVRPQATATPEAPRPADATLPAADVAKGFALPADQLLPVTLIGLQVQAGDAWPMGTPAGERRWPGHHPDDGDDDGEPARTRRRDAADEHDGGRRPAAEAGPSPALEPAEPCDGRLQVDDSPAGWLEPLARAINDRLAAAQPPEALAAAAAQWSRGRCVLLVCPRSVGAGPTHGHGVEVDPVPAWAFVLWPRRGARARGPMALRFAFSGQRIEARLQWPRGASPAWCSVRAVKQHLAHGGRQLVALDAGGAPAGPVPCEVQLGPVRAAAPRWRLAGVRIDAVRRLWGTLGGQWSVLLAVCPEALLAPVVNVAAGAEA